MIVHVEPYDGAPRALCTVPLGAASICVDPERVDAVADQDLCPRCYLALVLLRAGAVLDGQYTDEEVQP